MIAASSYSRTWKQARGLALVPDQVVPVLAFRRTASGARVSRWLDFGVNPTEVVERAGNSVEILLSRYAKCIDGWQEIVNRKIEELLHEYE